MTAAAAPLLRPLRLPELLDQAIRLYRNNFLKFIGIFAIPYIPVLVFQTITSNFSSSSMLNWSTSFDPTTEVFPPMGPFFASMAVSFLTILVSVFLLQGVATAALTRAVADAYTGKSVGILDTYRRLGGSWARLILAILLVMVLSAGFFIWFLVPCVGWFTGFGLLLFFALVVSPLVAPVVVLEKNGVMASVRRAWDLARSRFWWLFGFVVVLYIFGQLVVTGPVLLANFALQSVLAADPATVQQQLLVRIVIQSLITMFFSLLYSPLQLTAMTLVYLDLRVRSEGLDLAMQTAQVQPGVIPLPETTGQPRTRLLTGTDVGYFTLLSFGAMGIVVLFYGTLFGIALMAISGLQ